MTTLHKTLLMSSWWVTKILYKCKTFHRIPCNENLWNIEINIHIDLRASSAAICLSGYAAKTEPLNPAIPAPKWCKRNIWNQTVEIKLLLFLEQVLNTRVTPWKEKSIPSLVCPWRLLIVALPPFHLKQYQPTSFCLKGCDMVSECRWDFYLCIYIILLYFFFSSRQLRAVTAGA